MKYKHTIN